MNTLNYLYMTLICGNLASIRKSIDKRLLVFYDCFSGSGCKNYRYL